MRKSRDINYPITLTIYLIMLIYEAYIIIFNKMFTQFMCFCPLTKIKKRLQAQEYRNNRYFSLVSIRFDAIHANIDSIECWDQYRFITRFRSKIVFIIPTKLNSLLQLNSIFTLLDQMRVTQRDLPSPRPPSRPPPPPPHNSVASPVST